MKQYNTGVVTGLAGLALLIFLFHCGREPRLPVRKFSAEQLRGDFHQLEQQLGRHVRYFTDDREVAEVCARHYAQIIDSMSVLEFCRLIAPVLAAVRCGHARLSLPRPLEQELDERGHYLPLDIRAIGDSLYLVRGYPEREMISPGSAVLSINGRPADKIIERLKRCLPADGDNETFKYWTINQDFAAAYLEFVDDPEEFNLRVRARGDTITQTIAISAQSRRAIRQYRREHGPATKDTALVSSSFAPDGRYALLQVHSFCFYQELDEFIRTIDAFFNELRERNITNLILDLRGNDGGDPYSSAYLLGYLLGKPFRYFAEHSAPLYEDLKGLQPPPKHPFTGALYVLIDGGCFSTTGHFCSLLKYHRVGIFIGEETGGSFACNGGYQDVCLDHTGICFLLSRTTFITAVEGLAAGRGILPDYEVRPSISDIVTNHDVAIESVKILISAAA